jgi:hypothetical protein
MKVDEKMDRLKKEIIDYWELGIERKEIKNNDEELRR